MARPRTYSPAQIQLARELFSKGEFSLYKIADFVGMGSPNAVRYWCKEEWKRTHLERCKKWQASNRKRMFEKQREYYLKTHKKNG